MMVNIKFYLRCLCLLLAVSACLTYIHRQSISQGSIGPDGNATKRIAPVVYLALGDSTGAGVGARHGGGYVERLFARIERTHHGSRSVNLCASGAATADVLREQVRHAADTRPSLITLGIGVNDLVQGVNEEQFAHNYEEIITQLLKNNGTHVVLMNIPDVSLAPAVPAYMRDAARRHIIIFNKRIAEIATRHNLTVVDLYGRSREFSLHREFFSEDGIHPSDEGYESWAVIMWPVVEKAIDE